mmetsp:Transcript_26875/g.37505  ORF Transcript_26875/g.37505 Transcript_26875/m.37505 type:complete len:208 (+) Transcript_26875:362-985(+)
MPWLTSKTTQYLQGLQSIKSLSLSGVMHLSDNDVAGVVAKAGHGLRIIDLSRVKAVGEKSLKAIGNTCTHLHTLRMYACEAFSASALSHIGKVCSQLQILDICGSKHVDDECIEKLARGCPRLERLNLQWCVLITDRSLAALASCRRLTSLSLHGIKNVTDSGMKALSEGCREMLVLDINGCIGIHNRTLEHIRSQYFPKLVELVVL